MPTMFAAKRKRLTRRAAREQVDSFGYLRVVKQADVRFAQRPGSDVFEAASLILSNCLAGVPIKVGDEQMFEGRARKTERQASRSNE